MISVMAIRRALQKERYQVKSNELLTPFTEGVIAGLALALGIIEQVWRNTPRRPNNNPMGRRKVA